MADSRRLRYPKRLFIAVCAAVLSTLLLELAPPLQLVPLLVYVGSVVVVARFFGYNSAAWTAALSSVACYYYANMPSHGFAFTQAATVRVLGYLFVCSLIVSIARERRFAEKKLRTSLEEAHVSLERLRRAQEVGRVASWEFEVGTGQIWWSDNAASIFSTSRLTQNLEDFMSRLHADDIAPVKQRLQNLATEQLSLEYRIRDDEGVYRWYHSRTRPLVNPDGSVTRILGATVDIDERKQAERALLNTEKLAAAGRLSATIAHEINNPLEAVGNLLYLALRTDLNEEARDHLTRSEQELQRVSHIAKQTLGFYRSSTQPRPVDIAKAIEETIDLYQRRADGKRATIRFVRRSDAHVLAAEGEVKQILSNLLANSIDAVDLGGTITVMLRARRATVTVFVCDNGPGIPLKVRERLFEPFFTTKKDVGTGLGLWVSRGLAENLKGSLTFRSRLDPPTYTTFRLALPRYESAPN